MAVHPTSRKQMPVVHVSLFCQGIYFSAIAFVAVLERLFIFTIYTNQ